MTKCMHPRVLKIVPHELTYLVSTIIQIQSQPWKSCSQTPYLIILIDELHGFRDSISTVTQLVHSSNGWSESDRQPQWSNWYSSTCTLLVRLLTSHSPISIYIAVKLRYYGINDNALGWINSFLLHRKQSASVYGTFVHKSSTPANPNTTKDRSKNGTRFVFSDYRTTHITPLLEQLRDPLHTRRLIQQCTLFYKINYGTVNIKLPPYFQHATHISQRIDHPLNYYHNYTDQHIQHIFLRFLGVRATARKTYCYCSFFIRCSGMHPKHLLFLFGFFRC